MFGWLASHAALICRRADTSPVQRRWLRMSPLQLARHLPQLGSVLYLPEQAIANTLIHPPHGLLVEHLELSPLLQTCWLAAASVISSDGPHEWLECIDRYGRLRARMHLLPDTDYLAWDALLAIGAPIAAPVSLQRPRGFRAESARVLCFRTRQLAGLALLSGIAPVAISTLGLGIAGEIARAEAVELRPPVAVG
jgi:hypothetical protein